MSEFKGEWFHHGLPEKIDRFVLFNWLHLDLFFNLVGNRTRANTDGHNNEQAADRSKRNERKPRQSPECGKGRACDLKRPLLAGELLRHCSPKVVFVG